LSDRRASTAGAGAGFAGAVGGETTVGGGAISRGAVAALETGSGA